MITHLQSNYYKITPASIKEKSARMTYVYDVNQPFKTAIDQIETAVNFSNSGRVPLTPEQVATTAYDLILPTGYFTNSCQLWNLNPSAEKTWGNFKPFFANKHQTWQETKPSPASGIYPSSNFLDQKTYETVDAITILATATASDRETYTNLATTVASRTA